MNFYSLLGLSLLLVRVIYYPESGALLVSGGVGLFILGIVDVFWRAAKARTVAHAMYADFYNERTEILKGPGNAGPDACNGTCGKNCCGGSGGPECCGGEGHE